MAQTPNQARAAQQVAAWLAAHEKNNAWLVDATSSDPGTIGDFLNGHRWPKVGTQGRIEKALGWPPGSIRQIGNGSDPEAVGALLQDADYVAAPGDDHGEQEVTNAQLLAEMRAMREAIERLANREQPGP